MWAKIARNSSNQWNKRKSWKWGHFVTKETPAMLKSSPRAEQNYSQHWKRIINEFYCPGGIRDKVMWSWIKSTGQTKILKLKPRTSLWIKSWSTGIKVVGFDRKVSYK